LDFQLKLIWHIQICKIWFIYLLQSVRMMHFCSFDDMSLATSGFDFLSHNHLSTYPSNLLQLSLSTTEMFLHFTKFKMVNVRHLASVGEPLHHPKGQFMMGISCTNFVMIGLVVSSFVCLFSTYKDYIFCCSGLKVLFTPTKFQFLGLTLKFTATSFRPQ